MEETKDNEWEWNLVNNSTGEIRATGSYLKDRIHKEDAKVKAIKKENLKGLISLKGIKGERHSRVYHGRRIPTDNWRYKGYILDLTLTLAKNTNEIAYITEQGRCYPMDANEIMEYLDISVATFYRFINDMKSLGVIAEVTFDTNGKKRTSFVINPAYTSNGMYLNILTFRAFETDKAFQGILTEYHLEQKNLAERSLLEPK